MVADRLLADFIIIEVIGVYILCVLAVLRQVSSDLLHVLSKCTSAIYVVGLSLCNPRSRLHLWGFVCGKNSQSIHIFTVPYLKLQTQPYRVIHMQQQKLYSRHSIVFPIKKPIQLKENCKKCIQRAAILPPGCLSVSPKPLCIKQSTGDHFLQTTQV